VVQIHEVRTLSTVLVGFLNSKSMETKCKILSNIVIYSMSLSVTPCIAWNGRMVDDRWIWKEFVDKCLCPKRNAILAVHLKDCGKYWRTSVTVFDDPTEIITRRLQRYYDINKFRIILWTIPFIRLLTSALQFRDFFECLLSSHPTNITEFCSV
jgi:hypothetical protein